MTNRVFPKIKRLSSNLKAVFLLGMIVVFPFITFNRNPDLLHDSYFYSQAQALLIGDQIHRDIFSPYGPLVPWLLAMNIKVFGNYLIISRILGLIVTYATLLSFYKLIRMRLSASNSLTLVALFVCLSPERTEISSARWIYGSGIWPTSVAILLTLIAMYHVIYISNLSYLSKFSASRIFILSFCLGGLVYCRIQGILAFLAYVVFTFIALALGDKSLRSVIYLSYSGILTSLFLSFLFLKSNNALQVTFYQMIVSPFTVAGSVMNGRWLSWGFAFMFSFVTSVISFALMFVALRHTSRLSIRYLSYFIALLGAITFYLAAGYSYPDDLNKNPLLYALKVASGFPNWWNFSFFLLFAIALFGEAKKRFLNGKEAFIRLNDWNLEKLGVSVLALCSLSHLFWNFAYVYNILPVLVSATIFLVDSSIISKVSANGLVMSLKISIMIFSLVTLVGVFRPIQVFADPSLGGFVTTRNDSKNLNILIKEFRSLNIKDSSQYFCSYPFFRNFDPHSYKVDKKFFESVPNSKFEYLKRLPSATKVVVVCDSANFFSPIDLRQTNWEIKTQWTLAKVPAVQVLEKVSGG